MIRAVFTVEDGVITGFSVSGHAGFAEQGSDIVCAAVSSAAYMTVNTVTDVQELSCSVTVNDGHLTMSLSKQEAEQAQVILNGFLLHLDALSKEYPAMINIKLSEV